MQAGSSTDFLLAGPSPCNPAGRAVGPHQWPKAKYRSSVASSSAMTFSNSCCSQDVLWMRTKLRQGEERGAALGPARCKAQARGAARSICCGCSQYLLWMRTGLPWGGRRTWAMLGFPLQTQAGERTGKDCYAEGVVGLVGQELEVVQAVHMGR
jgi:hypothetical protein